MKKSNGDTSAIKAHNALVDLARQVSDAVPDALAELDIALEYLADIEGFQRHHKAPIKSINAAHRACKKLLTRLNWTNAYVNRLVCNEMKCSCEFPGVTK